MTLTYIFKVKYFNTSETEEIAQHVKDIKYLAFLAEFQFAKLQMNTKLFQQICLHRLSSCFRLSSFLFNLLDFSPFEQSLIESLISH